MDFTVTRSACPNTHQQEVLGLDAVGVPRATELVGLDIDGERGRPTASQRRIIGQLVDWLEQAGASFTLWVAESGSQRRPDPRWLWWRATEEGNPARHFADAAGTDPFVRGHLLLRGSRSQSQFVLAPMLDGRGLYLVVWADRAAVFATHFCTFAFRLMAAEP